MHIRTFPALLLLLVSSPAHAERIDMTTSDLLNGARRVAELAWDFERPIGGGNQASFSEVWSDGDSYIYRYGVSNVFDLDAWTEPLYGTDRVGGDRRIDFVGLSFDIPPATAWGFTDVGPETDWSRWRAMTGTMSGGMDCAGIAPYPDDPLGCESGWIQTDFDAFDLNGSRLSGAPPDQNTFSFYVKSPRPPMIAPLALSAIFSSQAWGEDGPIPGWAMIQASADVFAPSPVPEPASLLLVGVGVCGWLIKTRRQRGLL